MASIEFGWWHTASGALWTAAISWIVGWIKIEITGREENKKHWTWLLGFPTSPIRSPSLELQVEEELSFQSYVSCTSRQSSAPFSDHDSSLVRSGYTERTRSPLNYLKTLLTIINIFIYYQYFESTLLLIRSSGSIVRHTSLFMRRSFGNYRSAVCWNNNRRMKADRFCLARWDPTDSRSTM